MKSEWKAIFLKDIIEFNPRESLKKGSKAKKIPMEALSPFQRKIEFIKNENFTGGVKFRNGDTLMARITPSLENGKTAFVDILNKDEVAFGSTEFFVLRAKQDEILPKYLYYLSISNDLRNRAIKSMTGTSGRQRAQKESILDYEIFLPRLDIQKKIVDILDSLDSKIELNNQMIATLEELAATLFKRWFVDFEFPDENGNPYKSSGGKMVDSELGEIPDGWSTTTLGSQVSFEYGKSLTKSQRNFGTIPVYGSNGIVDYHDKELVSGPGIIIGRKGTVGTVNFSSKDFFPIDTTFWVKILTDTKPINYFYFLLKNLNLDNLTSDSAVPGLNRNTALRTEIVVPTERIINHFERTVETFRYLSDEIEDNIGLLGDVRDSLLPKILSGKIEV